MHEGAPQKVDDAAKALNLSPRLHLNLYVTYTEIRPATSFAVRPEKIATYFQVFRKTGFYVSYPVALNEIGISRDPQALNHLARAHEDAELGLALGYPQDAVRAFVWQRQQGQGYLGLRNERQLATALMQRVPIPTWFAYLNHCSVNFDPIEGRILEGSRSQGIEYMIHVRETNPRLASVVEADFARKLRQSLRREAHFAVSGKDANPEVAEYVRAMTEMRRKSLYGLLRKPILVDAV